MASAEQKELMEDWRNHTGFDFMRADEARASDRNGFIKLWEHNVSWLKDLADTADFIINDYRNDTL